MSQPPDWAGAFVFSLSNLCKYYSHAVGIFFQKYRHIALHFDVCRNLTDDSLTAKHSSGREKFYRLRIIFQ